MPINSREYNDELFFEAVWNDMRLTSKWAEICMLNRTVPAPLDEKSIYSLYVFGVLEQSNKDFADFYEELYDEVKDRVDGIILHYNRGCEGLSIGIAENRLGLIERGNKVMAFEGNMADEREFDEAATMNRISIFLESLGLEKPKK